MSGWHDLSQFFDTLVKKGQGRIRCEPSLGAILMYINGKWWPVAPKSIGRRDFIPELSNYSCIKVFKHCIKVFTRCDGRNSVFHVVESETARFSLYSDVIINTNYVGMMNQGGHYDMRSLKYIRKNKLYNANFECVYTFDEYRFNPSYIRPIKSFHHYGSALIINDNYACECDSRQVIPYKEQGKIVIDGITYYWCDWRLLVAGNGHKTTKFEDIRKYAIKHDEYVKFPVLENLCCIYSFKNVYVASRLINGENSFEEIKPIISGSRTKAALRDPIDDDDAASTAVVN